MRGAVLEVESVEVVAVLPNNLLRLRLAQAVSGVISPLARTHLLQQMEVLNKFSERANKRWETYFFALS